MRSLFIKKLWLSILLSLSIFIFPLASTKSQSSSQQKPNKLQRSSPDEMRESEELKARGVIVKFHRWPNSKEQKEIIRKLKAAGLKKTKSIRNFQTWLFEWLEGGLKPSRLGEIACKKLKNLSYIKRCNPEHLLPLNLQQKQIFLEKVETYRLFDNSSPSFVLVEATPKTEADFIEHCTSCNKQRSISPVPLNIRTCNLISYKRKLMDGKLSDYWAQELIGSDLLREELKKISPPKIPHWLAVFDDLEEDHMIGSKKLIADKGLHAVLPELGDEAMPSFETSTSEEYKSTLSLFETGFPGDYLSVADYLKKKPPHFINNSQGWLKIEEVYEGLQKLSPPSIVITASGNARRRGRTCRLENLKNKASKNFNAIVVGSFSPNGFVSDFSCSGEGVHILAPSDYWLTSAGGKFDRQPFGGTSGATPLVTGSLAGFEWLSGYHPTPEEAKVLLEKTAIPTLHSHEEYQVNGMGLLNSYKLGEVGKRLKKKCENKSPSCFKEEILKDENYHFDLNDLDKDLKRDINKVFPSCAIGKKIEKSESSNCNKKGTVFKRLRKAILLNPEKSKEFLKSLSCIYKEGGFSQNAEALDKLGLALGSREEVRTSVRILAKKEEPISDEMLRLMLGMGGFEEEFNFFKQRRRAAFNFVSVIGDPTALSFLEKAFDTGEFDLQVDSVKKAGYYGEAGLRLVEKAFDTDNIELQVWATRTAGLIGKPGWPWIKKAFKTDNPDLQSAAVVASAQRKMGDSGFPLIEQAYNTGNPDLQIKALEMAGRIGERGLPLIEKAYNTNNLDIQAQAVRSAGFALLRPIGKAKKQQASHIIEHAFKTGNRVLMKVAVSAADFPTFLQILKHEDDLDYWKDDVDRSIIERIRERSTYYREKGLIKK